MTTYAGSCHCGAIAFHVEGTIDSGLACNCSMCARRASLLWFVPREQLKLQTPEDNAGTYLFNKHMIRHRFCPACGIHAFGEANDPQGNAVAAVNLRCIEGIDLDAIPVKHYDGRAI
ncbi:GFA family protein [Variovorax dokdonensis]|uniref:GFA family protein n=1 Tax=Variovorax dokdonensis TaxID=344883 RepID=A0ABT7NFA0_9BURK|nr:GFA family protein [Variovorax dokdonensis]